MLLKFKRAVKAGTKMYEEGKEYEVEDSLAKLLVGKGYVEGAEPAAKAVDLKDVKPEAPKEPVHAHPSAPMKAEEKPKGK